jgi:hypothetical protein
MRLTGRSGLSARARVFFHAGDLQPSVHLRCGGLTYVLDLDESRRLVDELLRAIERGNAGAGAWDEPADSDEQPENSY